MVLCLAVITGIVITQSPSMGQGDLQTYIDSMRDAQGGMTIWQMIKGGGVVMIVLVGLSVTAMAIIVYNFRALSRRELVPQQFMDELRQTLKKADWRKVELLCRDKTLIIARLVSFGISMKEEGTKKIKEPMEAFVRREIEELWQKVAFLADIASIAPLLGLLGTVIGMIQAFNVIAFQTGVVKPILLAGGVSKAMVTTAGGLIVAIPVLLFYSYFRHKIEYIASTLEHSSADIIRILEEKLS